MKGSDYIAKFLHAQGVTHVFEVVGGMIAHILDSLHRQKKVRIVSMHHEQGAAFAADAMGRLTGIPGVALATSGPGAVNLLTGMGSCYFDSSPAVFITGQVNRHELKGGRPIRQLGFQETDIVPMAAPITKGAFRVNTPEELPNALSSAFTLALSGRPGPVLLDIPMDVQGARLTAAHPKRIAVAEQDSLDPGELNVLLDDLRKARRPLILTGGGLRSKRTWNLLVRLLETIRIPVVNSLMSRTLPDGHPLRAGFIGSYGNRWANLAIGKADFMLVLGSRLDVRQTGSDAAGFKGGKTIYHVDCDAGEMNNRVTGCRVLLSHLHPFLESALQTAAGREFPDWSEWRREIRSLKARWPDAGELRGLRGINPNVFMRELSQTSRQAAVYSVDVGQHQMWAAQSLGLQSSQRLITSGGMGAMGFALPAAIGAAFACPGKPSVVIAGDGGFQVNIQELQTVARNRLPLKIVILNNGCHGMVRQFQESYFGARYQSTLWGYSAPDFAAVAKAYGIDSAGVKSRASVPAALRRLWKHPLKPFLLQVAIDPRANAYPKIAYGRPITEMEPQAKPVEMEGA